MTALLTLGQSSVYCSQSIQQLQRAVNIRTGTTFVMFLIVHPANNNFIGVLRVKHDWHWVSQAQLFGTFVNETETFHSLTNDDVIETTIYVFAKKLCNILYKLLFQFK